jgi:hypothetical protein
VRKKRLLDLRAKAKRYGKRQFEDPRDTDPAIFYTASGEYQVDDFFKRSSGSELVAAFLPSSFLPGAMSATTGGAERVKQHIEFDDSALYACVLEYLDLSCSEAAVAEERRAVSFGTPRGEEQRSLLGQFCCQA